MLTHPSKKTLCFLLPTSYLKTACQYSTLLQWSSSYFAELRRFFLACAQENLSSLSAATNLVIDETFKVAPRMFTQLLTAEWRILSTYFLLPGKTKALYTNLHMHCMALSIKMIVSRNSALSLNSAKKHNLVARLR